MRKTFLTLACLLLATMSWAQADADHNFKVAKNLEVFNTIYRNLDMMYVDTLDADEVVGYGINSMLHSLDPFTEYYPEDMSKDVKMMLTGKYAGIGSLIRYNFKLGRVCIDEPYENMPAAEVGLKKGDVILSIDGEDMTKRDNNYVSDHLRGDAGTTFLLKVLRPSTGKEMKFKITRRAIQLPAVPYYGLQQDGIGYLNLNQFTEGCGKIVRNAIIDMKKQGMKALVFDLRGNGGGSEPEAVNIVNCFVPKGKLVVSNRGKVKRMNNDYFTTVEPYRHARGGARQRQQCFCLRDHQWRPAGYGPCRRYGYEDLRQRTRADRDGPALQRQDEADDQQILYPFGSLYPEDQLQTRQRRIDRSRC